MHVTPDGGKRICFRFWQVVIEGLLFDWINGDGDAQAVIQRIQNPVDVRADAAKAAMAGRYLAAVTADITPYFAIRQFIIEQRFFHNYHFILNHIFQHFL